MNAISALKSRLVKHPLIMTGFDSSTRTELTGSDADEKADMLTYINRDEGDKLVSILNVFTSVTVTDTNAVIAEDIFEEGLLLRYLDDSNSIANNSSDSNLHDSNLTDSTQSDSTQSDSDLNKNDLSENKRLKIKINRLKNNPASKTIFVPFRFRQFDAYRRLFYLAVESQIRMGNLDIVSAAEDQQLVTVTSTDYITPNMVRIYIKSTQPLPADDPGFAYRFALITPDKQKLSVKKLFHSTWQEAEPKIRRLPFANKTLHSIKKYGYLAGLEILKRRSVKRPNKIQPVGLVEKRYYTLRQLITADETQASATDNLQLDTTKDTKKTPTDQRFSGEVDVYVHDDTPGSVWAKSLQAGDKIHIDHHYHESIKRMTIGQPLLICDETSMPSVAAVLERWQVSTVPLVIQITNDEAERAYFNEVVLPPPLKDKLTIHHVNAKHASNIAQSVIDIIEAQQISIDCAWGAIGSKDYRAIKKYLKEQHGLKGKLNRVRAYWVAE